MQTILIVDDTKANIDILLELLNNYDIITSLSGVDAIKYVKEEKIDLILLDIMMPQMDGFEVCEVLKADPVTKNIPIIFLTAKNDKEDIEKGFSLGAVDYLTKPFYPSELRARVKTHLELRAYQNELETRVAEEAQKNRLKDQLLFQTSKEAEIGELLMQISHQWKQPLMEIGSLNMYNTAQIKLGKSVKEEDFLNNFEKIGNILKFMSNTMESFQNFYKPEYKSRYFNIVDAINTALTIIGGSLQLNNVSVTLEQTSTPKVYGNLNEYSNIIFTILNNVKDIAKHRGIKKSKVCIHIDSIESKSKVEICDNCGGIDFKNTDDIFQPFVSERKSAGFGLYMAKNICEKYGGELSVRNKEDGACFTIII